MESLTIEILNPKAKKLLQALAEMNLISISQNFLAKDEEEWDSLTKEQKEGIFEAINSIKQGNGIPHAEVMSKIKMKLFNG
ncbi:MAG: hypothetical protein KJ712_11185 [Bacteroidetes bacterium]|nr:hypothetical protein [Bacteroidota bacterium]